MVIDKGPLIIYGLVARYIKYPYFYTMHLLYLVMVVAFVGMSCGKTRSCIDPSLFNSTQVCPPIYDPVCGCDDYTYSSPCNAERNGVVSWTGGPCLL